MGKYHSELQMLFNLAFLMKCKYFELNVRNELRPFQMIKIQPSTLDLISVDFISNIVI